MPEAGDNLLCIRKLKKASIPGIKWGEESRIWDKREVGSDLAILTLI